MRNWTSHKLISLIPILLCFIASLVVSAEAQVRFVHITDPHIFDDVHQSKEKPSENEYNIMENRAALTSLIGQINERARAGEHFDFIVVTGDLGIEGLVLEHLSNIDNDDEKKARTKLILQDKIEESDKNSIDKALGKGARELAALIASSSVTQWLFVPGNNDVPGELPQHVRYYHDFMKKLDSSVNELNEKIKIVDLCSRDGSAANYASSPQIYRLRDYAFIGFDDASFKNKDDKKLDKNNLIVVNRDVQKRYAEQVGNLVKNGDFKYAYIFYHIPEIDDPWLASKSRTDDAELKNRVAQASLIGNSYYESAWFVDKEVREEWNKAAMNEKVKGLFAGHFHDSNPQRYDNFDWLRTTNYPGETLKKLHIAPPLAFRMQRHKVGHARGFREVFLNTDGSVSSRIVFLENGRWDLAAGDAEAERQLALATTYADSGNTTEAAAAYAKAAESNWPPTRAAALRELHQLNGEENKGWRKYFWAPLTTGWNASVNAFGVLLFPIVLALLAIVILLPVIKVYAEESGRNKLRVNTIIDSPVRGLGASFQQLITQVHGTKAAHYRKRWFDTKDKKFPMLAGSQSAEVPELIGAVVPGALGKVLGWLYRNTDKPRYHLSGTIQTVAHESSVFVAVSGGGVAKRWRRQGPRDELIDHEVIVAHASLDFLVKEMNSGRIR